MRRESAAGQGLELHRLGRKRVADTLLAATLLSHGIHRLATYNAADFGIFEGLTAAEPGSVLPA